MLPFSLSKQRSNLSQGIPGDVFQQRSPSPSSLRAASLLVYLHLMLYPVVQLKVIVLQRCGGARREPAVGAGAVEKQSGANRTQQDAQRAHHDDSEEDGVQRVEPGVVLVLL